MYKIKIGGSQMNNIVFTGGGDCEHEFDSQINHYIAPGTDINVYMIDRDKLSGLNRENMTGVFAPLYNNFGVYILKGKDFGRGIPVYVGRSGERSVDRLKGLDRVKQHLTSNDWYKEYWDTVIYFTTSINSMDLGVIAELERQLILTVKNNTNIMQLNSVPGNIGNVPRSSWVNIFSAILSFMECKTAGCPLLDTVNLTVDRSIVVNEAIERNEVNNIQNVAEQIVYTEISEEDRNILEHYKKMKKVDEKKEKYCNSRLMEVGGRVYYDTVYQVGESIYGKKSPIVLTPKHIAREMIDKIPLEKFRGDSKFLCLESKDGAYACELLDILMSDDKRLPINNDDKYTDKMYRLEHILTNMIYCVCDSVELTDYTIGKILYRADYWVDKLNTGKYITKMNCNLPNVKSIFNIRNIIKERGALYVKNNILKEFELYSEDVDMRFDAVVGNPPFQGESGRESIYHRFVELGILLSNTCCLITRDNWMAGKAFKGMREKICAEGGLVELVHYPQAGEAFKNAKVATSIMLWERGYSGKTHYKSIVNGEVTKETTITVGKSIVLTDNLDEEIVDVVKDYTKWNTVFNTRSYPFMDQRKRYQMYKTFDKDEENCIAIMANNEPTMYTSIYNFTNNVREVSQYKVVCGVVINDATEEKPGKVLTSIKALGPQCVSSESYSLLATFETEIEAVRCKKYFKSVPVRYLANLTVNQRSNVTDNTVEFIPVIDFLKNDGIDWSLDGDAFDIEIKNFFGFTDAQYEKMCKEVIAYKE